VGYGAAPCWRSRSEGSHGQARGKSFGSGRIAAGHRLLVVVDVNKNPWHQINYGTGGDVSADSIADAGEPLRIEWANSSYVDLPVTRVD